MAFRCPDSTGPDPDDIPPAGGTLQDWQGWWLELRCCCTTLRPLDLTMERFRLPGCLPPASLGGRLRCRRCGGRPRQVALVRDPTSPAPDARRQPALQVPLAVPPDGSADGA
jgi:hypothetical protein